VLCCCRFIWLLVLPFGIFPEASWWALLLVAVMALMMLGLEDAAVQLEDAFKSIAYGGWY
jgi:predicted membrane chloride channel (bestrophin family)